MKTLIVAEIGVNHGGSENVAYKLIDAAVESGADCCKFQLFKPELLTTDIERRRMLAGLLLKRDAYIRLGEYCAGRNIGFSCTAFDIDSLEYLLKNTAMDFVKISSGQYGNLPLLAMATQSGLPVIQSINNPAYVAEGAAKKGDRWRFLHVVPLYPTPPEKAGLKYLSKWWCSGLSDHSGDIFMPLAAVSLGAKIIECHITLDKNQEGPDHKASLTPKQFKEMVKGIRAIEKGMQ